VQSRRIHECSRQRALCMPPGAELSVVDQALTLCCCRFVERLSGLFVQSDRRRDLLSELCRNRWSGLLGRQSHQWFACFPPYVCASDAHLLVFRTQRITTGHTSIIAPAQRRWSQQLVRPVYVWPVTIARAVVLTTNTTRWCAPPCRHTFVAASLNRRWLRC
jgi:hypothetical protein